MARVNEKIDQTFKGSLKNDPDKKNPKHGLACEYLFEKLREKQYQKEIHWLKINLKDQYKKIVIKEIKKLIDALKTNRSYIVLHTETLLNKEKELNNSEKPENPDDYTTSYARLKSDIYSKKSEIERFESNNKIFKTNIKNFLKCRTEIFRLLNQLRNPIFLQCFKKVIYDKHIIPSKCIEAPIKSLTIKGRRTKSVIGFADVLIPYSNLDYAGVSHNGYIWDDMEVNLTGHIFYFIKKDTLQIKKEYDPLFFSDRNVCKYSNCTLGEVKISKQTAEDVLQHINQYHEYVSPTQTFVCLDYEDPQLKNLTENSKIKVVKLGQKFIEFCENRPAEKIEEI
jgi:hypothetical protein